MLRHRAPTHFLHPAFLPQKGRDFPDDSSGLTAPQPTARGALLHTGAAEMERKVFGAAQPELRDNSPQTLQLHLSQGSDPTAAARLEPSQNTLTQREVLSRCVPSEITNPTHLTPSLT